MSTKNAEFFLKFQDPVKLFFFFNSVKHKGTQKLSCALCSGIVKELFRRVFFDNESVINKDNPVCNSACKFQLVGYNKHCLAFLCKFYHYIKYFPYHLGVKCCGNFVKKHNLRVHAQCPYNSHTLFLAARKLSGVGVLFFIKPDAL